MRVHRKPEIRRLHIMPCSDAAGFSREVFHIVPGDDMLNHAVGVGNVEASVRHLVQVTGIADGEIEQIHIPSASGERSEEHTSELQSLMRISYAVFCLKQ